ncbi:MAG: domain containing protein [Glaciihabitans sp.]|nr:domain containing protein [Glaciihabitans sp.]
MSTEPMSTEPMSTEAMSTPVHRPGGTARIESLYRYPIKGLSPERLNRVPLAVGKAMEGDRVYALAWRDGLYNAENFEPLSKRQYMVLLNTERIAGLQSSLDLPTRVITVSVQGNPVLTADLNTAEGRAALEQLYARVCDLAPDAAPVLAEQDGYNFTDNANNGTQLMNSISLINLASITEFEQRIGRPVDPLRFRANVYIEGLEPWVERDWVGQTITLGDVALRVLEESGRCAATEVDPVTARRDIPVPRLLHTHYGHDIMGVYAEVISDGTITDGDTLLVGTVDPRLAGGSR